MNQDFLTLLMGIDETKSTELMRQQLTKIIDKITAPDFKINFDSEQMKVLERTLEGISGNAGEVVQAFKSMQSLKLESLGTDKIAIALEEIRLKAADAFKNTDVSVLDWSKSIQGELSKVVLSMEDGELGFKKMVATIGEMGEINFSDVKVFPQFEKEIKNQLKSLEILNKEISALEKKSGKGVITDTETVQKTSKEDEQLQKIVQLQQTIGLGRKEGIITEEKQIELTKQLSQATRDFAAQRQQAFQQGGDEKLAQEARGLTQEYQKAYKELERLEKQMKATPAQELASEIARLKDALEGLESAAEVSERSKEAIAGAKAKQLEEKAITELIEKYRSIEPTFKKAERAVVQLGNAQRKALETAKGGTAQAQASAQTNVTIAESNLRAIREEIELLGTKPEYLETVLVLNQRIAEVLREQNGITEQHRGSVDLAHLNKTAAKYGESTGLTVDPKDLKNVNEELLKHSSILGEVQGRVKVLNTDKGNLKDIESTHSVQIKTQNGSYQELIYTIDRTTNEVRIMNRETERSASFFERMGGQVKSAAQKIAAFTIAGSLTFGTLQKMREGWAFVSDLDKDLTQVAIVQGRTRASVQKLAATYSELGQEMGKTTKEISSVNTELVRQGLGIQESEARMRTILKLSSVGMITSAESLKIITSAVNALGVSHQRAADVLVKASQISASSVEQLGEAFTKAASSARAMGMTIEQTTAILATMVEKTQEGPSELGTSLKTIMARFSKVNEETGEFNEELNDVQGAIESVGIQFLNSAGEIRNMYDVLQDLGGQWNTLDKNTKAYLATQIAGVRQQNRFFAVMSDFNRVLEIQNELVNARGTLDTGYATYLDGVEAKSNSAKAALEGLYSSFLSSEIIVSFYEFLAVMLQTAEALGLAGTAAATFGLAMMLKNLPHIRAFGKSLLMTLPGMDAFIAKLGMAAVGGKTMNVAFLGLLKTLGAVAVSFAVFAVAVVAIGILGKTIKHFSEKQKEAREEAERVQQYTANVAGNHEKHTKKVEELTKTYVELERVMARLGGFNGLNDEQKEAFRATVIDLEDVLKGFGMEENRYMEIKVGIDGEKYVKLAEGINSVTQAMQLLEKEIFEKERSKEGVDGRLSGLFGRNIDSLRTLKGASIGTYGQTGSLARPLEQTLDRRELESFVQREIGHIRKIMNEAGRDIGNAFTESLSEADYELYVSELILFGDMTETTLYAIAEAYADAGKEIENSDFFLALKEADKFFAAGTIGVEDYNKTVRKSLQEIEYEIGSLDKKTKEKTGSWTEKEEARLAVLQETRKTIELMTKETPPDPIVNHKKIYDDTLASLDTYNSNLSSLHSALEKIKKGEKLNREEKEKLIRTFPEIADGYAKVGDAIFANGNAIQSVAKTAREEMIKTLQIALMTFATVQSSMRDSLGNFHMSDGGNGFGATKGMEAQFNAIKALIASLMKDSDPFAGMGKGLEKGFSNTVNVLERGLAQTARIVSRTKALLENEFSPENKLPLFGNLIETMKSQQGDMTAAISIYEKELSAAIKKINNPKLVKELTEGTFDKLNWTTTSEKLNEAALLAIELYDSKEALKDALDGVSKDLVSTRLNQFTAELEVAAKRMEVFSDKAEELAHAREMLGSLEQEKEVSIIIAQQTNALAKQAEVQRQIFDLQSKSFPKGSEAAAKQAEEIKRLTSEFRALRIEAKGYGDEIQAIYDEMYEAVKNLIRQEKQDELDIAKDILDTHKQQLDILNKTIEARRKAADNARKELEFARQISQIEMRKAALQRAADSGDRRAAAKLTELLDQETKIREDQAKYIEDREDERIKEKYQAEYDEHEKTYKAQEETIKKFLENAQKMHIAAATRINQEILTRSGVLFKQLEEHNLQYGTGIEGITKKWEAMLGVVQKVSLETNKIIAPSTAGSTGKTLMEMGALSSQEMMIATFMKKNSDEWHGATAERRKELERLNKHYGAQAGWNYDSSGIWKKDGVRVYDNGGYKPKGVTGIMGENTSEWFFKDKQLHEVQKMAISEFLKQAGGSFQGSGIKDVTIHINGNIDKDNLQEIKQTLKQTLNEINKGQLRAWQSRGVTKIG